MLYVSSCDFVYLFYYYYFWLSGARSSFVVWCVLCSFPVIRRRVTEIFLFMFGSPVLITILFLVLWCLLAPLCGVVCCFRSGNSTSSDRNINVVSRSPRCLLLFVVWCCFRSGNSTSSDRDINFVSRSPVLAPLCGVVCCVHSGNSMSNDRTGGLEEEECVEAYATRKRTCVCAQSGEPRPVSNGMKYSGVGVL